MVKLCDINLDVPFFQASMSGYTDRPMRLLARKYGAPLTLTGVMLDKLTLHPKAVKKLLSQVGDDEYPVGAQILGTEPETMACSAAVLEEMGYDLIDLNFACPAPKVLRRKRGGYLMRSPDSMINIYRRVRQSVKCPVIVKVRIGFDGSAAARDDFWQFCERADAEGVDGLVIHGRTVEQKYRSSANWAILAEVKQRFGQIKVFGSGDLFDAATAVERLTSSGVDGVIIARGAIGNPWIFREVRALLEGKPLPEPPSIVEQGEVMLHHFEMVLEERDMIKAVRYFRKFSVGYCRRHPQRKKVQAVLMAARNKNEVFAALKEWYGVG